VKNGSSGYKWGFQYQEYDTFGHRYRKFQVFAKNWDIPIYIEVSHLLLPLK